MARTNPLMQNLIVSATALSKEIIILELSSTPQTHPREILGKRLRMMCDDDFLDVSDLTMSGYGAKKISFVGRYRIHLGGLLRFIVSGTIEGVKNLVAILTEQGGFPAEPYHYLLREFTMKHASLPVHGNTGRVVAQERSSQSLVRGSLSCGRG